MVGIYRMRDRVSENRIRKEMEEEDMYKEKEGIGKGMRMTNILEERIRIRGNGRD